MEIQFVHRGTQPDGRKLQGAFPERIARRNQRHLADLFPMHRFVGAWPSWHHSTSDLDNHFRHGELLAPNEGRSMKLAHHVYFTLIDDCPEKVAALVADMQTYLADHTGLDSFGCGTLNPDLDRPVNDRGFHVSLHLVFADRAAHDAYQVHPRHVEFVERNRSNWKLVRVFDSDLVDPS